MDGACSTVCPRGTAPRTVPTVSDAGPAASREQKVELCQQRPLQSGRWTTAWEATAAARIRLLPCAARPSSFVVPPGSAHTVGASWSATKLVS